MTIKTNDIINIANIGVNTDKTSKTDYTTQDFSSISNKFTNIFNSQMDKQFENQFSYNQTFLSNNTNSSNFMSNTASKSQALDEKYYSPSNNTNQTSQTNNNESYKPMFEQDNQQTKNKPAETTQADAPKQQPEKVPETTQKETKETKNVTVENNEQIAEVKKEEKPAKETKKTTDETELQAQVLAMVNNAQNVKIEKDIPKKESAKKELPQEKTIEKTENSSKVLVNIKASEADKNAIVQKNTTENLPEVNVDLKDVKIEKLDVKQQTAQKEKTKEKDSSAIVEKDTSKSKTDETHKEDIKNKVSLERLTANVVNQETEKSSSDLDKILNKDIIKKVDTTGKQSAAQEIKAETNSQADLKNSFMNNQGFGQNLGQQNQETQSQLKANNMFASNILDASMHKGHIQNNFSIHNPNQAVQSNNLLEKNIFEQVMKNIQNNISEQKTEVSMILKPENLGKVTLNVMNDKGVISAEFKAETKEAADALNKNIQDLKETLKQQGVICSNLVVKIEEPNRSGQNMNFGQEQNNNNDFKEFSQENTQNQNKESFENKSNEQTMKNELNKDIQVEKQEPEKTAANQGVIDYRV